MNVLFVCTHNRCRSILAEAIFNHLAPAGIQGFSAGSAPSGQVHPGSIAQLHRHGIATDGLYSKSWNELEAVAPDIVITVCDKAAGEACPVFLGRAIKGHWGMPDPSQVSGTEAEIEAAFEAVYQQFHRRMTRLIEVLQSSPSADQIRTTLKQLETV